MKEKKTDLLLSRIDEVYLLAIWELQADAYGVAIKKLVSSKLGKSLSYGGLYFVLNQLVKKDLVEKSAGEPSPTRGGRKKFYYSLTVKGKASLKQTFEHQKTLWAGITKLNFNEKEEG